MGREDTSTTGSKGEMIVSAIARKERAPRGLEGFASTSDGLRYSEKLQGKLGPGSKCAWTQDSTGRMYDAIGWGGWATLGGLAEDTEPCVRIGEGSEITEPSWALAAA